MSRGAVLRARLQMLLMLLSLLAGAQQVQQTAMTDPLEGTSTMYSIHLIPNSTRSLMLLMLMMHDAAAAALDAMFGQWGLRTSYWDATWEPCSGRAIDITALDGNPHMKLGIKCDCSYNNNTVCHITEL